jgi:hypothetical protein
MERIELEVYSETSNHAVVKPLGREFPGTVVQGDSLSILCAEAKELSLRIKALNVQDEEFLYLAQDHQERLLSRLVHFQEVLAEHGIRLPYSEPVSTADLVVLVPGKASSDA